jgi:hypothetical protein
VPHFFSFCGFFYKIQRASKQFDDKKDQKRILSKWERKIKGKIGKNYWLMVKFFASASLKTAVLIGNIFLTEYFYKFYNGMYFWILYLGLAKRDLWGLGAESWFVVKVNSCC